MRITDQQLRAYLRHGFVVVPGFLRGEELAAAREGMLQYFPTAEELRERPQRYGFVHDDPEHLQVEFPFAADALNDVSTHPDLIEFVERALGTDDVLLSQAAVWAKYAGTGDFEQGLHLDYEGNTLVVPRDDGAYRQVNMILYYTDVGAEGGPTWVVSQEKTKDVPLWPTHRTRKKDPGLYQHERPVLAEAGDLLVFSMRTWHRAGAMTAETGVRLSHHLVWRCGRFGFQGYQQWSSKGEGKDLKRFIERGTVRQREALGFPRVGDPYWNEETLSALALRYPCIDPAPYKGRRG